jgi:hypothetical protein
MDLRAGINGMPALSRSLVRRPTIAASLLHTFFHCRTKANLYYCLPETRFTIAAYGLRIADGGPSEKHQPNMCTNAQLQMLSLQLSAHYCKYDVTGITAPLLRSHKAGRNIV